MWVFFWGFFCVCCLFIFFFFSYFSLKIGFDITYKICVLFSWKIKKNVINSPSAEFAHSMLSVKLRSIAGYC